MFSRLGTKHMAAAPTESDLLERLRGGDREAAGALYARCRRPVFDLLLRRLGNVEEAEALCQETFVRALRAAEDGRVRRFLSFSLQVARNLAVDLQRSRRREVPMSALYEPSVPADPLRAEIGRLTAAVEALSPDLRQILELRYRDDLSYSEIAGALEMSKNGVHARHERALAALRDSFARRRED